MITNILRAISALAAIVLIYSVPVTAQIDPDTLPPDELARMIRQGSDLYNDGSCALCHAIAGRGSGQRAPDLADVEWLHSEGDFQGIFQTILWGVTEEEMKAMTPRQFPMFPKGNMAIDWVETQALAAYVWSLSRPERDDFVRRQAEFLELARAGRVDEAIALFREARQAYPETLLLPENGLNRLGYEFLRDRAQPGLALQIFQLNVELHPEAWNPWDSLAEAYAALGDREKAIDYYEKSLELNPANQNAVEKLAELRGG